MFGVGNKKYGMLDDETSPDTSRPVWKMQMSLNTD